MMGSLKDEPTVGKIGHPTHSSFSLCSSMRKDRTESRRKLHTSESVPIYLTARVSQVRTFLVWRAGIPHQMTPFHSIHSNVDWKVVLKYALHNRTQGEP